MHWTICACWRPHIFAVTTPGIHQKRCECGRRVTIFIPQPTRWNQLEID